MTGTPSQFGMPPGHTATQSSARSPDLVLAPQPASTGRMGVKVAWALIATFVVVASAFAALWVAKSGDADDLTRERDRLIADNSDLEARLSSTEEELATATEQVESTSIELDTASDRVADLEGQVADLTVQVDDLGRQVEEFQAAGGGERPDLSDNIAFTFGSGLGAEAQPPLTQVEATCLGREVYGRVDTDTLVAFAFVENPSDDLLLQFINVLFVATGACDLDMERLGSA